MRTQRGISSAGTCLAIGSLLAILTVPVWGQQITGQWDFNYGDLRATIGTAAQYWIPAPPVRDAELETQFGTTTSLGIPDIAGQPAKVMKFPQTDSTMGYAMYPQIEANGGGGYVNQYTLVMDILYPAASSGVYRSLLQTSDCNPSYNDGDLFIGDLLVTDANGNPTPNGIGISSVYDGAIQPDTWYRVAFAFDLAAPGGPTLAKYIDGVQVGVQTLEEGVDGRWSLYPQTDDLPTLLFVDDNGETAAGYVNSIQVRGYAMPAEEVAVLGAASASGIPMTTSSLGAVTGQWDFENGNLNATVGRNLLYFKGCQTNCSQNLPALTQFGPASSFGLPRINRADPLVMGFPLVESCNGYLITHGAAPNGGGNYVNKYTLIMDVLYPAIPSDGWVALYQTNMANNNDSDWFIRGSDHGLGIGSVYGGLVQDGTWNRLALVVDLERGTLTSFVNGTQVSQKGSQDLDGRFALDPAILLFTDDSLETAAGYVNSIQFRDYAMTPEELQALGGPTAAGIGFLDARPAPDANGDGYVNQADYLAFLVCMTGPAILMAPENEFLCTNFDEDGDGDVDQDDFGKFQQFYTGANTCTPNCVYP